MTLRWMPAAAFGGKFKAPAATFVVVHCTESDNNPGTAESLAGPNWFGGPAGTSAHRMFDRDSGVEMVRGTNVAYHAGPGGNTWGRSYEFCGRAAWSAAKWREPEQLAALKLAAPYMAQDLIEITGSKSAALGACRWLSVVQVAGKAHGLCTHNDIRLAFPGTTTHSDPGPNFPYAELLSYVRAALTGTSLEEDDMPTADEIADAVWTRRIKTPDSVTTAETILANVEGFYNHAVPAIVNALLDAPVDRPDGRGPTSLRGMLAWNDNHVDALASGIAAAVSSAQAGSIAGPVDAAAVQRAVQDAVNNITVKLTAG